MHLPSLREKRRARVEIIPLIDIIFFLLATFVMVSLSMIHNRGINVNLPGSISGTAQPRDNSITISIDQEGKIYVDQVQTPLGLLPTTFEKIRAINPETRIFLNSDKTTDFGDVVTVLDELRRAGLAKIAIETRPKAFQRSTS